MLYNIYGLCPSKELGGKGFAIQLWPGWRDAWQSHPLTQDQVNKVIEHMHRIWLDGCGFDAIYDPEEDPLDRWKAQKAGQPRKLSTKARPMYGAHDIRIQWGEWGPEHITVPGNACGLDLDQGMNAPLHGRILSPHNIDSLGQVVLLLVVFSWFANHIVANIELDAINKA